METNVHNHKCCQKQKLRRGLWSPDEDEKLKNHMMSNVGSKPCTWSSVPELTGIQRCGKSCRLRWINYLRPDLKRGSFTPSEERRIIDLHRILGNKWSRIASYFPGRTDNEIKNLWNSSLRKKMLVGKAGAMNYSRAHMPSKYINLIASANDPNIFALGASASRVNHIINDTNLILPTTNPLMSNTNPIWPVANPSLITINPISPIPNPSLITSNHEVLLTQDSLRHYPQQNPSTNVIDSIGEHPSKPNICLVGCDMDQSPRATWHFHDMSSSSSIPSLLDSCQEDVSLHWFDPEEVTSLDQVIGPFHK